MHTHSWQTEFTHYRVMAQSDQIIWLSLLLHAITTCARDTYEAGTDEVTRPSDLRRINEFTRRVASFLKHVATSNSRRPSDAEFFEMLELSLAKLNMSNCVLHFFPPRTAMN